jgi:uncharacterized RDD family membrane protein YckC
MGLRRYSAWLVEVVLITTSALVPFQVGLYAKAHFTGEVVPLNPLLVNLEESIAQTLAIPIGDENQQVAPLTNLLWSGAVLMPLVLAGSQAYLLAKTGKTSPKAWFGVEITTALGAPPGLARVLLREGIGRWGLPLGTAYVIWRYSGAFPDLSILIALAGLLLLGEGLTPLWQQQRRALHDRFAGTYVLDAAASVWQPNLQAVQDWKYAPSIYSALPDGSQPWTDEDGAIAAIVLAPNHSQPQQSLGRWVRNHPGVALLIFSVLTLTLVLGTFVGTQVYIQSQANWRESQQQQDQMFLALVGQLTRSDNVDDRRTAILTLAATHDPRATPLLTDLLAQETNP